MINPQDMPGFVLYVRPGVARSQGRYTWIDGNMYYGLNVSSNICLEPIDQVDGFLLAAYSQRFGSAKNFYPYIAGCYNVFNARSIEEARKVSVKRQKSDLEKKKLLKNVITALSVEGEVLTTYDMWDDARYWEIVDRLFADGIYEKLPAEQRTRGTILMSSFPSEVLGKMSAITKNIPRFIESGSLYIPVEIAEAIWLRERYGVGWKIGPPSEDIYDEFIQKEGIGIVRLRQPNAIENNEVKGVMPYIGKSTQPQRILFSDTKATLARKWVPDNPSFEEALRLADIYEALCGTEDGGPLERVYRLIKLGENS